MHLRLVARVGCRYPYAAAYDLLAGHAFRLDGKGLINAGAEYRALDRARRYDGRSRPRWPGRPRRAELARRPQRPRRSRWPRRASGPGRPVEPGRPRRAGNATGARNATRRPLGWHEGSRGRRARKHERRRHRYHVPPTPTAGVTPAGRSPLPRFKGSKPEAKSIACAPTGTRIPKLKLKRSRRSTQSTPRSGPLATLPCVKTSVCVSGTERDGTKALEPKNSTTAARWRGHTSAEPDRP